MNNVRNFTHINDKRNWKIYFEWIEGKNYDALSLEFGLAQNTIKDIVTSKVPVKVKQTAWQTNNQYAKWREYLRKQNKNQGT